MKWTSLSLCWCFIFASNNPALAEPGETTKVSTGTFSLIVQAGTHEPASSGSYSIRIYRGTPEEHGDFIDGQHAKREGTIAKIWSDELESLPGIAQIIVWCQSAGSGSYGSVDVFSVGRDGRLTRNSIPSPSNFEGYMGHDRFFTKGNVLFREVPMYLPNDSNTKPTGGNILYRLDPKSKTWVSSVNKPND